jgi:hypothetical protein
MANALYNGIKGIPTDVSLKTLDGTQRVLVVPNASEVSFDQGIELEEVMAASPLGEMTLVDIYPRTRNPRITAKFPKKTPELLGMKMGFAFEEDASMAATVARNGIKVTGDIPASTAGFEGFGIVADVVGAEASYLSPNQQSVPLTQVDFADPMASLTLSFSVGLNGAMKFSPDLLGKYVSYQIPVVIASGGLNLTETAFSRFQMNLVLVQRDLKIFVLEFPEVISPGDGEISFNDDTIDIEFRMVYDGSNCLPFRAKYLGLARKCVEAVAA